MLRRLRTSAGLSQERLAERSGISATGVAALEAGRRKTPRLNTVGLLCDGLQLDATQRAALFGAAAPTVQLVSPIQRAELATSPEPDHSFVGRTSEWQNLRAAWAHKTKVTLLLGEAGVGKSTLAEAFATEMESQNVVVLRGRSTAQKLGAYETFLDPIRSALNNFDGTSLALFRDLRRLVPELFDNSADRYSRSDPTLDRRLFFESVCTLLVSGGPTLLFLDDLQWADTGALALLSFLAAAPELTDLMVVGTIRSTDIDTATSAALAELRRRCTVERILLTGLSKPEVTALVSTLAGTAFSCALIDAVSEATNGNPLYIKELTEHLLHSGFDETGAGQRIHSVPAGIRDTIELRVAGLSKEAQSLLRCAAILGQHVELQLAGHLAGLTGEVFLGAVEDALLSGLVVEESANTALFSHGLVATTILEATSLTRRLVLHRGAAIALAERNPTTTAEIVNVERHWAFVAAADPSVRSTAAQWSVRAGDAAWSSAAVDEAIACYQRAAALWGSQPKNEPAAAGHASALVRLGSALTSIGKVTEGNQQLQNALDLADSSGDSMVFARAALSLSASVRYGYSDPERIAQLEAAIAKLDPSEMVLRPALLATLRRQLGFVNTVEADRRRIQAAQLVLEAASSPTVSDELVMSLGSLRDSLVVDDPVPLGELARKIIRVATVHQDLPVLSTGWYRQAWSAFELGDSLSFHKSINEYRLIAERLRRPYELAMSSNMLAAVAQVEGRYDDAEAAGQEALAHASTIEDGNFSWVCFANSGIRSFDRGTIAESFEFMQAIRPDFVGLPTFEAALVATAALAGEPSFADQLLAEQIGVTGEVLDRDWSYLSAERLPVLGMLAWGCSATNNKHYAHLLLPRLQFAASIGVRIVRVAAIGAWIGPIDHHIGALHRVVGNLHEAKHHLNQALKVADEMNGRPFPVRTMLELAAVADSESDSNAQKHWLGLAEEMATKLGFESMLP
jgi:transcriptional regulator with XRE-family HTH domain/tetratricopeptide (TPR) repeat protein